MPVTLEVAFSQTPSLHPPGEMLSRFTCGTSWASSNSPASPVCSAIAKIINSFSSLFGYSQDHQQLPHPKGAATAKMQVRALVKALAVSFSLLFGAVVSSRIMWPLLKRKQGNWLTDPTPSSFRGINGYRSMGLEAVAALRASSGGAQGGGAWRGSRQRRCLKQSLVGAQGQRDGRRGLRKAHKENRSVWIRWIFLTSYLQGIFFP
jgi:hypothetical protein